MNGWMSLMLLAMVSCGDAHKPSEPAANAAYEGTIRISADESFKPVLEEQRKAFEDTYPKARLLISYKSEADCLKDLNADSVKMVFVARGLTEQEDAAYRQRLGYPLRNGKLAFDAVVMIVNKASTDTLYSWAQLQNIVTGTQAKQVAVDGNNATSVVRLLLDTVAGKKTVGSNLRSADSSAGVVSFVAANANSVGFVGSSWINALAPATGAELPAGVKLAMLECRRCDEAGFYALPTQKNIYNRGYPLVRTLNYVLNENSTSVGTTFVNFLSQERGQLIFRRARLVPAQMTFQKRNIQL